MELTDSVRPRTRLQARLAQQQHSAATPDAAHAKDSTAHCPQPNHKGDQIQSSSSQCKDAGAAGRSGSLAELTQAFQAQPDHQLHTLPDIIAAMLVEPLHLETQLHAMLTLLMSLVMAPESAWDVLLKEQHKQLEQQLVRHLLQLTKLGGHPGTAAHHVLSFMVIMATSHSVIATKRMMDAMLADNQAGLKHLVTQLSSRDTTLVAVPAVTAVMGFTAVAKFGAESHAVISIWYDAAMRQQQGLLPLLRLLSRMQRSCTTWATTQGIQMFAVVAPSKFLEDLTSQHGQGLHLLVDALASNSTDEEMGATLYKLAVTAEEQPLQHQQALMSGLIRAVQLHKPLPAVLVNLCTRRYGSHLLLPHLSTVLRHLQHGGDEFKQALVQVLLWIVMHSEDGARVIIEQGLPKLIKVMLENSSSELGAVAAAAVFLMSIRQPLALAPFTAELVAAAQPSSSLTVGVLAMECIEYVARAAKHRRQPLLQHVPEVLAIMQLQEEQYQPAVDIPSIDMEQLLHPAVNAGLALESLLATPRGIAALVQEHNLDAMFQAVQQFSTAYPAARLISLIAAEVESRRPLCKQRLFAAPQRLAALHGLQEQLQHIHPDDLQDSDDDKVPEPLMIFQYMTAAAAVYEVVPEYVDGFCRLMPSLRGGGFEVIWPLTYFEEGLLALAPHVEHISTVVRLHNAHLCSRVQHMLSSVEQAVVDLKSEAAAMQGSLHYAVVELAHACRKLRPFAKGTKWDAAAMLWVQQFAKLSERNAVVQQQLDTAEGRRASSAVQI